MGELPSRGERFINHMIDYRAKKMSDLAKVGNYKSPYLKEALYYDTLANTPNLFESKEECQDLGLSQTAIIYEYPSEDLQILPPLEDRDTSDTIHPDYDNPIGKV